jgi:hypothetical protein
VRTFPIRAESIHSWIRGGDTAAIRQHGWDLWESITSPSPQDSATPVWETWYAGHEIFEMDTTATTLVRRAARYRFEFPRQARHAVLPLAVRIPHDPEERWLSFNRYTRPTAQRIFKGQLWNWKRLKAINDSFNVNSTPVADREVMVSAGKIDPQSIVLKPVFQFIDGANNSCIPYWNGNTPATSSNNNNPVPLTWKQFVVVDVANKNAGQKKRVIPCLGARPAHGKSCSRPVLFHHDHAGDGGLGVAVHGRQWRRRRAW